MFMCFRASSSARWLVVPSTDAANGAPQGLTPRRCGVTSTPEMTVPLRVLHIVHQIHAGGLERMVELLVRHINPDSFDVEVMCLSQWSEVADRLSNTAMVLRGPRQSRAALIYPRSLARAIAKRDPHVVHCHSGVWYKAARAARMAGVRWVVHSEHGRRHPEPFLDPFIDRRAARHTDVIVAVSRPLEAYLRRRIVGPDSALVVIPNGVDTDSLTPGPPDRDFFRLLGITQGAKVIGSAGRLEPVKGYEGMLRAFKELCSLPGLSEDAPYLVIAGDGSQRPRLESLARQLQVHSRVRFVGWKDDLKGFYRSLTIFTLASQSEGTSVGLLEAMSCGVCPVVTDVGGNAGVLGPDLAHRLVPAGRPAALAAAWRRSLQDDNARDRDSKVGRARVKEDFGLARMVEAYQRLYAMAPQCPVTSLAPRESR